MADPHASGPARRIVDPLVRFLHDEAAGGVALLVATTAALVWANAAAGSYESLELELERWRWRAAPARTGDGDGESHRRGQRLVACSRVRRAAAGGRREAGLVCEERRGSTGARLTLAVSAMSRVHSLHLKDRLGLTRYAIRRGLIDA